MLFALRFGSNRCVIFRITCQILLDNTFIMNLHLSKRKYIFIMFAKTISTQFSFFALDVKYEKSTIFCVKQKKNNDVCVLGKRNEWARRRCSKNAIHSLKISEFLLPICYKQKEMEMCTTFVRASKQQTFELIKMRKSGVSKNNFVDMHIIQYPFRVGSICTFSMYRFYTQNFNFQKKICSDVHRRLT